MVGFGVRWVVALIVLVELMTVEAKLQVWAVVVAEVVAVVVVLAAE